MPSNDALHVMAVFLLYVHVCMHACVCVCVHVSVMCVIIENYDNYVLTNWEIHKVSYVYIFAFIVMPSSKRQEMLKFRRNLILLLTFN